MSGDRTPQATWPGALQGNCWHAAGLSAARTLNGRLRPAKTADASVEGNHATRMSLDRWRSPDRAQSAKTHVCPSSFLRWGGGGHGLDCCKDTTPTLSWQVTELSVGGQRDAEVKRG